MPAVSTLPPAGRRTRRRTLPVSRLALAGCAAVTAALVGACAAGGAAGPTPSQTTTSPTTVQLQTMGGTATLQMFRTPRGESMRFPVRADSVWLALGNAYDAVGLEPNTILAAQRTLGVASVRKRARLGRERLSRYLTCGSDVTGVPNADSYNVTLNVSSQVVVEGEGSVLTTLVTADARPMTTSGDPVSCGTTGALEARIADEVRARLGR